MVDAMMMSTQPATGEDPWARIVEAAACALVLVDRGGAITFANPAAATLFGYQREALIGLPFAHLVPATAGVVDLPERLFAAGAPPGPTCERSGRGSDGSARVIALTLSPLATADGARVLASIVDLSEHQRQLDDLRRSNAELEQFAHIASHDLQEPLRMVASFTELLAERYRGQLDERADKYIHFVVDGARRMQHLIVDLLGFARVGSQGRKLAPVDAGAALQDVLNVLAGPIASAGASVQVGPLPWVLADDGQLRQLLQNLLGNALKFRAERPPEIAITAARKGDRWCISVRDNGIGIEQKYAGRIFQMFQRLHERDRYEGSGIGLAIARRIVSRHRGEIWFESQPGVGTTFHFSLLPALPDPCAVGSPQP